MRGGGQQRGVSNDVGLHQFGRGGKSGWPNRFRGIGETLSCSYRKELEKIVMAATTEVALAIEPPAEPVISSVLELQVEGRSPKLPRQATRRRLSAAGDNSAAGSPEREE